MMSAIAGVIEEMGLRSRQLVCHMHFLKAVGKSILEGMSQSLKSQFRQQKTLASLNRFVKEAGGIIEPEAAAMRCFVYQWGESGAQINIPGYMESVAVLRALAQWVILFGSECGGAGFPFALSHTKLFDRCSAALGSLLGLIGKGRFHEQALKYAARLQRILQGTVEDTKIQKSARDLKAAEAVFTELRAVLRLERTDVYKQEKDKKSPDKLEVIAKLKEEASGFCDALRERLASGTVTGAEADASCIVIGYFDQYERYLFDHFAVTYDASGNIVINLIERSNNIMEKSYCDQKHDIRRRTGAKNLGFVFERLFPAAAMVPNLENPVYQQTVLGNKTQSDWVDIFSPLDAVIRYRGTPMYQDDFDMIGGRLPKADRKIVGKTGFSDVIYLLSGEYSKPLIP